jgi:glycerol uptake facilitator-like aquaporin
MLKVFLAQIVGGFFGLIIFVLMFHYSGQSDLYQPFPNNAINTRDGFLIVMIVEIFLTFLVVATYMVQSSD